MLIKTVKAFQHIYLLNIDTQNQEKHTKSLFITPRNNPLNPTIRFFLPHSHCNLLYQSLLLKQRDT